MLKRIHHVGIVVKSLDDAYRFYRDVLGLHVHKTAEVRDQGVRAALLTVGHSKGTVARFLEKRGEGMHHVCFETDDVERELAAAKAAGIPLIDEKPRPGLAGRICFLHPKGTAGVLVEYAEPVD